MPAQHSITPNTVVVDRHYLAVLERAQEHARAMDRRALVAAGMLDAISALAPETDDLVTNARQVLAGRHDDLVRDVAERVLAARRPE